MSNKASKQVIEGKYNSNWLTQSWVEQCLIDLEWLANFK